MLVLTRKSLESVVVGGGGGFERLLKITVLEVQGNKVRLGFDGDVCIPIHRQEVWERMRIPGSNGHGDGAGHATEDPAAPIA